MSPLFRRNRRAREDEAGVDEAVTEPPTQPLADDPTAVHPDAVTGGGPATPEAGRGATVAVATPNPELDAMVGEPPTSRRRGRLRRRLRHLRRVREVLLRDLGGIVFEIHKAGSTAEAIVQSKLHRLATVDAELRELESLLDDRRAMTIREPGIGGSCPECGELYGSEARYCWSCGSTVVPGEGGVPHLAAYLPGATPASASAIAPASVEGTWVEQPEASAAEDVQDAETVESPAAGGDTAERRES